MIPAIIAGYVAKKAARQAMKHAETKATEIVVKALVKEAKSQVREAYATHSPAVQGRISDATSTVMVMGGAVKKHFSSAVAQVKETVAPEAEVAPAPVAAAKPKRKRAPAKRKPRTPAK